MTNSIFTSVVATAAILVAGTAGANIPVFVAMCPGDISVESSKNGVVQVNGAKAKVEQFSSNFYEAKSGAVTVSVSANGDKAPEVSFTGIGHAHGICQVTSFERPKPPAAPAPAAATAVPR